MSSKLSINPDNNIMVRAVVTVDDYQTDREKIVKRVKGIYKRLDHIEKNNKRRNWVYSSRYKRRR